MNKLWFQKWVCDWRGWGSDMRRLRRVLDAYKTKGVFGCCACLLKGMMVPFVLYFSLNSHFIHVNFFALSASTAARGGRASILQLYSSDTPSGLKPFMLLAFPITPLDVLLSAQHHAWDEQRKAIKAAGPSWPPSIPNPPPSVKDSKIIRLGYVARRVA